jgi:hypothetical protein
MVLRIANESAGFSPARRRPVAGAREAADEKRGDGRVGGEARGPRSSLVGGARRMVRKQIEGRACGYRLWSDRYAPGVSLCDGVCTWCGMDRVFLFVMGVWTWCVFEWIRCMDPTTLVRA